MQRRTNRTPVLPIPSHFRLSYSNRQPCDVSHKERQPTKLLNKDHLCHLHQMGDWTRTLTRTSLTISLKKCTSDVIFVLIRFSCHWGGTLIARNMMWMITGFAIVVKGKDFFHFLVKLSHRYPNCKRARQHLPTRNEQHVPSNTL